MPNNPGKELIFQLISRLGLELPPGQGENPIAQMLNTDGYTPDDEPYLRQFMGIPKDGGLIPTDLRPKGLTVNDNLPWYRPSGSPIDHIATKAPMIGRLPRTTALAQGNIDEMGNESIVPLKTPTVPGLGHFTASVGKNESGNPYLSVYDKWDFNSPVVDPLIKAMLERTGAGFHVYERYPLQRGKTGYDLRGDIELPSEK